MYRGVPADENTDAAGPRVSDPELRALDDASAGAWIAPSLTGEFGAVTLAVPSGYEAYVRIFHPAQDGRGGVRRWSEIAHETGRHAHRLMQWHAIVGSSDPLNFMGSLCAEWEPERGNLDQASLAALCDLLAAHTANPEDCCFCMWEGWGELHHEKRIGKHAWQTVAGVSQQVQDALDRPRLRLPGRDYLLLAGSLRGALRLESWIGSSWRRPRSPNLFWPEDRAWCVASEIDFDSTLVGGAAGLVQAIVESAELEAWAVEPDDSLADDADEINVVPPPVEA